MTRSAYATISALTVPCPACYAATAAPCVSLSKDARKRGKPRMKAHPARRKAADAKRTADVHDFEIPPEIPLREPLPPRIPDLCPDDDCPENYGGGPDDGTDIEF